MRTQPISRRAFAAGLALAPVGGLPAVAAGPLFDARARALCELWQEWLSLGEMIASLGAKRDAAYGALPAWAKSGPKYLKHDGTFSGPVVRWPMDVTAAPPERKETFRLVRPSPEDHRRCYEMSESWGNPSEAKKAYVAALRRLARRRMDQRAEERKVGLPELDRESDALCERYSNLARAILDLVDDSADATAAKLLIALCLTEDYDSLPDVIPGLYGAPLKALQPHLTGRIAIDVGSLLAGAGRLAG
jgi:hypothetical protein